MQADDAGNLEQSCASLPYGDGETCGPAPTENLYTGKERDSESGNDYFGARYYASTVGRFLSPDWAAKAEPVPYAKLDDPQSLDLYEYMQGNPLVGVDASGHASLAWERVKAVRLAWAQEQRLAEAGRPTSRLWTPAQREELIKTGRVKGFYGHHINSVKGHEDMAGDPNNIEFLSKDEHLAAHGGSWQNSTSGELMDRSFDIGTALMVASTVVSGYQRLAEANITGIFESDFGGLDITDPGKAAVTLDGLTVDVYSYGFFGLGKRSDSIYSVHDGAFWDGDKKVDPNSLKGKDVCISCGPPHA